MNTENPTPDDREALLQDWEKRKSESHSVLSDFGQDGKSGGILIVITALLALVAVYAFKNSGSAEPQVSVSEESISIAGRRIVPELRKLDISDIPIPPPPPAPPIPEYDQFAAQQRQLELQEEMKQKQLEEVRRKSAILTTQTGQRRTAQAGTEEDAGSLSGNPQGRQDPNIAYASSVSGKRIPASNASRIEHLEYKVMKGKMIDAVLEPRVNSDLPGMICAIVQQDVYGSQGRQKLIPWGSRACGVYKSELRKGQDRIFVVWNEVVRPDGIMVTLDSVGSDQLGTTGIGGQVDTHFAEIFGTSALLAIIGAGAANVGVSDGDEYNSNAYYRQEVQHAAANSAQQVLAPYINMPPTVTVPQGAKVKIYVNRILDFSQLYKAEIEASKHNGVTFIR